MALGPVQSATSVDEQFNMSKACLIVCLGRQVGTLFCFVLMYVLKRFVHLVPVAMLTYSFQSYLSRWVGTCKCYIYRYLPTLLCEYSCICDCT